MNLVRTVILTAACLLSAGVFGAGCGRTAPATGSVTTGRVGTYNSRVAALAYGRSRLHEQRVRRMVEQHRQARAAEQTAGADEVEASAKALQRRLHAQVFGDAPIDDILALIQPDLDRIAAAAGVDRIIAESEWKGPPGAAVDVTAAIVMLFDPTEKTLGMIEDLRKHPPVRNPNRFCE